MASIQRLDTSTSLSSPEGGLHTTVGGGASHRSLNANLEKSHSFRDGHEGRPGGAGAVASGSELLPLTSVLSLDLLDLGDAKTNRQVELRRAINAAAGAQTDDPVLGAVQSKPLESCSVEELKRIRSSLSDNVQRVRQRIRHLAEAVSKLDRFAMQSRKRSRPDPTAHDRLPPQGPAQRPGGAWAYVTKGSARALLSSSVDTTSAHKGGEKTKSGIINKRVRTSLADARPEGRPSNLSVQRSSGVQERERDSARPSSFLGSPVEEKERTPLAGTEGWEKTKMKGRRSATIKAEAFVVGAANGPIDGEREHKGSAPHHRPGVESRSRPSEGHGFRSGPVHGITSMQKAETAGQVNGSNMRGGSKVESEGAVHMGGKVDRPTLTERERSTAKNGAKLPARKEAQAAANPAVITKAKGARGPRSNLVAGTNQNSVHLSRSSSFTDVREKASSAAAAQPKPQAPSGPTNRKRPAPSRSSSPPVASWGSSRPQKMARVARRVNIKLPLGGSTPPKEETNGAASVAEVGTPARDGCSPAATPAARSTPPVANPARRTAASNAHPLVQNQNKFRNERLIVPVVPVESEDLIDDGHKLKENTIKQEGGPGEPKALGTTQKMGSVLHAAKKTRVGAKEEVGGGDGVRRQGRTGRGASVALRVPAVPSPPEKVAVSPVNTKLTRSARASVDTKPAGPGRPVTKKGTGDRKAVTRPKRLLGNGLGELSGEEEDDHGHLIKAVQQALKFSVAASPNDFWRQVEPYFAYVTPTDLSFLHEQMNSLRGSNSTPHTQNLDSTSPNLANGTTEIDGAVSTKAFIGSRNGNGQASRSFSLSQRLLSAFINEGEEDDRHKVCDEACLDRDSDSPLPPSSHSEMDYDRRDPEGESDCDNVRSGELDWWSSGAREAACSEGSPLSGGQTGARLWGDDQEGDDILVQSEDQQARRPDWGGDDYLYTNNDQLGSSGQTGTRTSDWEEQYRRMSLDDRLLLELHSIGLLPEQPPEHCEQEESEIAEELRRLENQLNKQVCANGERLCSLEAAVLAKREHEERAREQLAMDKFVEIAFNKRLGGRSAKGSAAKGARVAALALAKRVLARAQSFGAGHSCIADHGLRDLLFCVAANGVKSAPSAAVDGDKEATGMGATIADRANSNSSPPLKAAVGRDALDGGCPPAADRARFKDDVWPARAKERELFLLDDVAGGHTTSTRDVNALSVSNGLGGIKGKRSERERDGKAGPSKDVHTVGLKRDGNSAAATRPGERKAKSKPRQKTGPLLKSVKGLVSPKPADPLHGGPRDRPVPREDVPQASLQDTEGHIDLSALPLPGMDDMSAADMSAQQDLGSWLDFDVEDPLPQTDEFLMGLDVPMDDLSELHMMM